MDVRNAEPTYSSLVGKTVKEAMAVVGEIDSRIKTIRVVRKDGKPCMVTADARSNRLNVEETNDRISKVRGIG